MKPTTLRLQENTLKALDKEAEEYDFDNRTEYIRFILDNRGVVVENTEAYSEENTSRLEERIDELEERVESLENDREQSENDETRSRTRSQTRDPHGSGRENTPAEQPSGDIEELLADWPPKGSQKQDKRRAVAVEALRWLRDEGGVAGRPEFVEEFYDEDDPPVAGQSEDTFWRKTIRPALMKADEAGVVEFYEGRWDYEWVG